MDTVCCAHCGLPVRAQLRPEEPVYCCAGCAVVAAVLAGAHGPGADAERSLLLRIGLAAFFSCGAMVLTLFLYSGEGAPPAVMRLIHILLAAFSAPVFALLAPPFLAGLARDARRARFSTDSLIALGSGAAFVFSCVSVVRGRGELYFDTATMVLLLVTVGRLLEAHAHVSSRRALRELISLQPPSARVLRGAEWTFADAAALRPGDRVRVLAGERIPADGRIAQGAAAIDESMLTGEALPAERGEGDVVRAGTLSLNGALEIDVDTAPGETLLARIVRTVEEAQRDRSPLETLADRLSAALVPLTLLLAAATAAWWWNSGPERALLNGLSVLVVACPCALGIALPMVNVRALGVAARSGILVRSAGALHELAGVDMVVFDKTGTVTAGCVEVRGMMAVHGTERELLAAAASAAAGSRHPASRAVWEAAARAGVGTTPARRCEEVPGRGVAAELEDGRRILLGRPQWVAEQTAAAPESNGAALVCAAGSTVLGGFSLHDPVTAEARQTIVELHAGGLRVALLSGDAPGAVVDAARALGIDHAEGALLPEGKAARIRAMHAAGRHVAMVGDGINDAPALASAAVGIAVSGGTDVARETARIVLLRPGLLRVAEAWRLARAARRMGRQNLAWAAAYNSLALAAAASGTLKPQFAAALMLASSACVTLNTLRLPGPVERDVAAGARTGI